MTSDTKLQTRIKVTGFTFAINNDNHFYISTINTSTVYFPIKYIIVLHNSGLEKSVHECAAVQVISHLTFIVQSRRNMGAKISAGGMVYFLDNSISLLIYIVVHTFSYFFLAV